MRLMIHGLIMSAYLFITGCASLAGHGFSQIYEGEPRKNSEISVLEKHPMNGFGLGSGVYIEEVDGTELGLFTKTHLQLLPGKHKIKASCNTDRSNEMTGSSAGLYTTEVELKAGYHYRVGGHLRSLPTKDWIETPRINFITKEIMGYDYIKYECRLNIGIYKKPTPVLASTTEK